MQSSGWASGSLRLEVQPTPSRSPALTRAWLTILTTLHILYHSYDLYDIQDARPLQDGVARPLPRPTDRVKASTSESSDSGNSELIYHDHVVL